MLTAKRQTFNRPLDISDPSEFLGTILSGFSISLTYPLTASQRDLIPKIQQEIYEKVVSKLEQESLGNTKYYVIDYEDFKVKNEVSRRYLKIEYSTARNTLITGLIRCLAHGDNLYIAFDPYILGDLNTNALVIQIVIALIGLYIGTIFPPILLLVFAYLFLNWIDVFRAIKQKQDFMYGLRCRFNKSSDLGSFNTDDTLMFLKSAIPMITSSVKETFEENGIPLQGIKDLLSGIESKVSGQTVTMEAGGNISLFGVNVASYNSQASGS